MSERLPVFHIGANKAGSTTLQQALFARHPEVLNLAKPSFVPETWQAVDAIRNACDDCREGPPQLDIELLKSLWRQSVAPAAERVPVVSYEELIRYRFYKQPDSKRLPRTIRAMAGPVRVAIIARHQLKLIESLYIHKANIASYLPFDHWLETNSDWLSTYQYHDVADAWAHVVGEANVGIFLFEELVSDPVSFANRLCSFIGIDAATGAQLLSNRHENVRKSKRTQAYVQLRAVILPKASLGKMLPTALRRAWRGYLEGGLRSQAKLPAEWLRRIEGRYKADNCKLAKRFDLPLQDYNYPM